MLLHRNRAIWTRNERWVFAFRRHRVGRGQWHLVFRLSTRHKWRSKTTIFLQYLYEGDRRGGVWELTRSLGELPRVWALEYRRWSGELARVR
jgi:hypothetical protein